jgi:hypothetical protein
MDWTSKEFWFDSKQALEIFNFSKVSRPVLRPIQHPGEWVLWTVFLEVKWLGCEAEGAHLQPLLRLRMSGAVPPLPPSHHGIDRDNFISLSVILSCVRKSRIF